MALIRALALAAALVEEEEEEEAMTMWAGVGQMAAAAVAAAVVHAAAVVVVVVMVRVSRVMMIHDRWVGEDWCVELQHKCVHDVYHVWVSRMQAEVNAEMNVCVRVRVGWRKGGARSLRTWLQNRVALETSSFLESCC